MALYIHITRCDYETYFEEVFDNIFEYGYGAAEIDPSSYKGISVEEWLALVEEDAKMSLTNVRDAFWTGASKETLYDGEEYLFQYNNADETGCNAISVRSPDKETMAQAAKIAEKLNAQIIYEGSNKLEELERLQYDFRKTSNRRRYKKLLEEKKDGNAKPWWKVW